MIGIFPGCLPSMWNPVGFVLGGFTMDAFGRKRSTTSVFIPFIAGWAVIVNARSLSAIYIGTALHGVASGKFEFANESILYPLCERTHLLI